MALMLLVDTSTKDCSVVLAEDKNVLSERFVENTQSHATLLPGLFEEVLNEASKSKKDLNAIVMGEGPGSYTGLRIGFSATKALAYTLDLPMIYVDNLEALARKMQAEIDDENAIYIATMKSRKGELYYCAINNSLEVLESSKPAKFSEELFSEYRNKNIIVSGNNLDDINRNNINYVKLYEKIGFSATNFVNLAFDTYIKGDFNDYVYKNPNYLKPFRG